MLEEALHSSPTKYPHLNFVNIRLFTFDAPHSDYFSNQDSYHAWYVPTNNSTSQISLRYLRPRYLQHLWQKLRDAWYQGYIGTSQARTAVVVLGAAPTLTINTAVGSHLFNRHQLLQMISTINSSVAGRAVIASFTCVVHGELVSNITFPAALLRACVCI